MSEPVFGVDGARTEQELDRWAAQVAERAERYQDMQRQVSAISSTESSSDGVVRVTVDSGGVLTDLRITDAARELAGQQLASLVLTTMRRAQSRLTGQVAEIMETTVPEDAQTVDAVVSGYRQRFPEPEPEDPRPDVIDELVLGELEEDGPRSTRRSDPTERRPRPSSRNDDDDDDSGGGSILE
jgi:DNA-binding protein YbaB